jgi:periplasmic divalent cation tolerance protein
VTTAYVTVPPDAVADLARTLVDERLAACVNAVDCESTYRWKGAVHEGAETILIAKTTADRYDALCERVRDLHPAEVPCIERFDETDAFAPFAAWRDAAVDPDAGAERGGDAE